MSEQAKRHRRKFTADYRREAAHLVIDTGRAVAHVAKEINVGEQLLGRWVRAERARLGQDTPVVLQEAERTELERLRKENVALRSEVGFLERACAFFAARTTPRNVSS
jgi:transposase